LGQLIKSRPYRQIWRIEIEGRAIYLKFYPREAARVKRLFLGNPALREFSRLQQLQKAGIPAPRTISVLVGFRINNQLGDAVLMHAIEPGITLDHFFLESEISAQPDPQRRPIAEQITEITQKLIRARLGHRDLHLGNFLFCNGQVYLLDAYALVRRGMKMRHLLMLGHSVRRYATKTEMLRFWRTIGGWRLPPANNRIARKFWNKELSRTNSSNAYFGQFTRDNWHGNYFKSRKYPVRWSLASRLKITDEDWQSASTRLIAQFQSQQFTLHSETPHESIFSGQIILSGVPLNILIHRPRGRFLQPIRRSAAQRMWHNAWSLIVRDIHTPWPLLMIERRHLQSLEQLIIFEHIPSVPLSKIDLNTLSRPHRDQLFHRVGDLLARTDQLGLYHRRATADNILIHTDPITGFMPMLTHTQSIRSRNKTQSSIHRLLQSLRSPQSAYNPSDSYSLCRGYAPYAKMQTEK
jgi:tRNA A-37 threonylcarbamoyl transferase component Bud32